jgi:hypothetical protein
LDAPLADGPEQEAREPAVSARADHEQIGLTGCFDEHGGRIALGRHGLSRHRRLVAGYLAHDVRHELERGGLQRRYLEADARERRLADLRHDHGRRPGVDGDHLGTVYATLLDGPPEGVLRCVRAVDAGDDPVHGCALPGFGYVHAVSVLAGEL